MTTEREKALELAIGQIEKRFGKGSIMKLGVSTTLPPIEAIPTGSLALDLAPGYASRRYSGKNHLARLP